MRPGGLLVFVTSNGTMDKGSDKARKYLSDRADLLGAIRLPQTAFQDNAGTEVVTDVIFLRKRLPGEAPAGQAWANLAEVTTVVQGDKHLVNEYCAANPDMVLGAHSMTGQMYRAKAYTVLPGWSAWVRCGPASSRGRMPLPRWTRPGWPPACSTR